MIARPLARQAAAAVALAWVSGACKPDLDQSVSLVSAPQILAVSSEPAAAAPRATVRYRALVVDSSGPLAPPSSPVATAVSWAFCNEREPLAELGPVSPKCYRTSGDWFSTIGVGIAVVAALPAVACRQFGPEVPQPMAHQPPGRPVDPDATGGYYQPLRLLVPSLGSDVVTIAETRLVCGLAGTPDQVAEFASHDVPNVNPVVQSLMAGTAPLAMATGGVTNSVRAGELLTLRLGWPSCPRPTGGPGDHCGDGFCDLGETAASCPGDCRPLAGCSGAESYVTLDLATHALVTQREAMQVSWFATAGSFDNDRTGEDSADTTNATTNRWRAPAGGGKVYLWTVLRDDRGGAGWAEYGFDVR